MSHRPVLRATLMKALGLGILLTTLIAAPLHAQTMQNAHQSSGSVLGNAAADLNGAPSLSDDGRHVAFATDATNLVTGDTNGQLDIFVRDLLLGTTVLITFDTGGGPTDGLSLRPALSGNGRYVAFMSTATDLVAGDTNGLPDVFRCDRDSDADGVFDEPGTLTIVRVSVSTAGAQGDGVSLSYPWAISDDGNLVVFESGATNLVAGDTNDFDDCFVRNVSAGTTTRVSVGAGGVPANGPTGFAAISGDGSTVTFSAGTLPDNLVAGDTNITGDVFVRILPAGPTIRVSVATGGAQSAGSSSFSTISDDGNRVTFESNADDLVAMDNSERPDIFVRDIAAGTTVRASLSTGGFQGVVNNRSGAISGDGNFVVWVAEDEFTIGDTNGAVDVYIRSLSAGTTTRASRAADGTQANGNSFTPYVSDDGGEVAFGSMATNLVAGDGNGVTDIFVRGDPFLGPNLGYGGFAGVDENPVSFSVNGPVDPNTEGIRNPRGGPPTAQVPMLPGNGIAFGIRAPAVPQASGIPTPRPGDVNDYATVPPFPPGAGTIPSEAVIFQAPALPVGLLAFPGPPGPPAPPDGTHNQFAEDSCSGLVSGPAVATAMWTMLPPMAPFRDNIDAISFGEDYFPPMMVVGPMDLPAPIGTMWSARTSVYSEPVVISDAPGISFRFSVDPWAIGAAGTAVATESGGADGGAGLGPWASPGEAAGDVFAAPALVRSAGITYGGSSNTLVHDNVALALAPIVPPLVPQENDLDALECVGDNQEWPPGGFILRSGNIHERLIHVGPAGLAPRGESWHEPYLHAPYFFSVTRNSPGEEGSAVRSQFVIMGGAACDVFQAVKVPLTALGDGFNLLAFENFELGLMAESDPASPMPSPADYCDDIDGLIVWICPEFRDEWNTAVDEILAIVPPPLGGPPVFGGADPWVAGVGGSYTGGGMTYSISKYLAGTGRPIPIDCIKVGFSVTTDAVGLEYTGVDWEAGPVAPPGGFSTAAGDVFYVNITGAGFNRNWRWYEEADLGLDPGAWPNNSVPGRSLGLLSDNLDGLDSIEPAVPVGVSPPDLPAGELGLSLRPNPFRANSRIEYSLPRDGRARVTVHDVTGRLVATLADGLASAGPHFAVWDGRRPGGASASAGIYFVRVEFGGERHVARLVRIE